jgi:hypothetical protein
VHLLRGNAHGAMTLLRRASIRIARYPDGERGLQTMALAARLEDDALAVEAGLLAPGPDAVFEPPDV